MSKLRISVARFIPLKTGMTISRIYMSNSLIIPLAQRRVADIKELDEAGRRIKIYDEFIPVTARKMSALKKACIEYKLNRGENS